jgi:hypothetical protein
MAHRRSLARRNPGIPLWAWAVGGVAVVGAGYLIYKSTVASSSSAGGTPSNITLTPGVMNVPAGTVTLNLPDGSTWVSLNNGGATIASGSSDPVTASIPSGNTATAVWAESEGAGNPTVQQTTTITAS